MITSSQKMVYKTMMLRILLGKNLWESHALTSKRSLWWHTTKCQLLHRGAGLPEIGKDHSNKDHARIMVGGFTQTRE